MELRLRVSHPRAFPTGVQYLANIVIFVHKYFKYLELIANIVIFVYLQFIVNIGILLEMFPINCQY